MFVFRPILFLQVKKTFRGWIGEKAAVQIATLEFEPATLNSCITQEKRDTTQSASSNHKCSRFYIASFYFRNLIWESRVSDSSSLGKAGVAPGFVVLSDTVFRNNSQQGGPEKRLKCHGRRCNMSNLIFSVSPHFDSWNEIWAVETYWRLLGMSSVFEKQVLLCESLNLLSNLPPLSSVPLTSDEWSCSVLVNILGRGWIFLPVRKHVNWLYYFFLLLTC